MTTKVPSYVAGRWFIAADEGTPVLDASTGAEVAQVSTSGLDFAALVSHAHRVGGPALRDLTFTQRALRLKDLADYLTEHADDLYDAYGAYGGTGADAQLDVAGGIGVLITYAKKALRELPDDTIYAEGTPERVGKTTLGQTVYTSRHGLVLAINAFNFPVWGYLEKLAPTILAGLPMIVKPATPTAPLAEMSVRQVVESGILPEGAIQLVSGDTGDLLDHLGGQDHIAFTGSARTAARLRAHPAVVERGVTFNAEADSLNATILGPDVTPGTELFDAFAKGVFREMVSKTGQKCTAIRRVLLPTAHRDEFLEALNRRLAKVVIGDPRVEGTTMGPLVSRDQVAEVRAAVRRLQEGAEVVIGDPQSPVLVASGDAEQGAFFAPTVLLATDIHSDSLHQTEAFGPVSTIFPYAALDDVAPLVEQGGGSLVASLVTEDPAVVREVVSKAAAFHGRILVLDSVNAATAMPHGAVLPQLIHGGPGRAGGGQELGGIRAVLDLMQATSVAGSPQMLVDLTGTWNSKAPAIPTDVHPFRRYLDDLRIGETLFTDSREITLEDIERFADLTGDTFYAHMDEAAAKASPIFEGRVAHGYLVLAAAAGLFVDPDPGPVLANFGLDRLRFVQPVYPGDSIKLRLTVQHKSERPDTGRGEVTWDVEVTNQRDEVCATYQLLTINAARPQQ